VDGGSNDGTLGYLRQIENSNVVWSSENDDGIYDAMNKGIQTSTGDVIGILNADDIFHNDQVLTQVMSFFEENSEIDAVYGDIVFKKKEKVWRHYSAKNWYPNRLGWGFMPPHPGVFLKRSLFEQLGFYKTDYTIAADYELIIRFFWKHRIRCRYIPIVTTSMSLGGVSTKNVKSNILLNQEIRRACLENGLPTNYLKIYSKYLIKWRELI
jgi:glycosyltransferase involved in cell wall biosynthesis